MPCTIASNNIPAPELREAVSKAIRDAVGERPGKWTVIVYQAPDFPAFAIRVEGPEGLHWSWTFFEREQSPEFIQQKVGEGIAAYISRQESSAKDNDDNNMDS